MKYRIKLFLGSDIGWLYIVDSTGEMAVEYTLQEAERLVRQWELYSKTLYSIIDSNGNEVLK